MLVSQLVADMLVESCRLSTDMSVLEIGTGRGILTEKLVRTAKSVTSFELDTRLYEQARRKLSEYKNLQLVCDDAFDSVLAEKEFDVCVTSLPYSQSLRFLKWTAQRSKPFNSCAAIVQSEFANKLASLTRVKSYRAASVIAQISFEIVKQFSVRRSEFSPPPKVDSIALSLRPNGSWTQPFFNEKRLRLIDFIFSFRGRLFSSVLKKIALPIKLNSISKEFEDLRIEAITPDEYGRIIPNLEPFFA